MKTRRFLHSCLILITALALLAGCGKQGAVDSAVWEDIDYCNVYRGVLNFYSDFLDGSIELSNGEMNN